MGAGQGFVSFQNVGQGRPSVLWPPSPMFFVAGSRWQGPTEGTVDSLSSPPPPCTSRSCVNTQQALPPLGPLHSRQPWPSQRWGQACLSRRERALLRLLQGTLLKRFLSCSFEFHFSGMLMPSAKVMSRPQSLSLNKVPWSPNKIFSYWKPGDFCYCIKTPP